MLNLALDKLTIDKGELVELFQNFYIFKKNSLLSKSELIKLFLWLFFNLSNEWVSADASWEGGIQLLAVLAPSSQTVGSFLRTTLPSKLEGKIDPNNSGRD
jgi:hypothetical protein